MNKKEMTKKYKQTIQPMGIYQIRNLTNGKIFIESSKNLPASRNSCFFQLKLGTYANRDLQAEFTGFGEKQFVFEVLDELKPKDDPGYDYTCDLATLKSLWMEKLQPYDLKGYHNNQKP